MNPLMKKILMGIGGAGAAGGGALYGASDYQGDEDVSKWDYYKTKFNLWRALNKLGRGKHDIEVATGMHRAQIPISGIKPEALKHLGYKGTLVAIPERGQQQLTSYRKIYDPKKPTYNPHIHKHNKNWFIHVDKHPSLTMALSQAKTPREAKDAVTQGMTHVLGEGVPGAALYLKNTLLGDPTMEDLVTDEYGHRKLGHAPLRPDNSMVPMVIKSASGEVRGVIAAEVVETDKTARMGMSGIAEMPENYGMLFKRASAFWMRDVNFDLDIVFADRYGKVTETQRMNKLANPQLDHAPVYTPSKEGAAVALELPAGWCERNNVQPGDTLTIKEN